MDWSICPFCDYPVPSTELQRHANDHFEDEDEIATEFQLPYHIAQPPFSISPLSSVYTSSQTGIDISNGPESSSSKSNHVDKRSSGGQTVDIDGKFVCLISLQIRETFYDVKVGLLNLLRNCLEADMGNSTSILSGHVDHFQGRVGEDVGWGCGWRNIQMLSSHLLKQRQEAREVLYGGCGFVPDIAFLQRWLELAWERGYDTPGSNYFDHVIYGKRNWIGTTECAALLRSFGLRARIVDFCSKEIESIRNEKFGPHAGKWKETQVFGPMDRFVIRGNCNNTQADSNGYGKFEDYVSDRGKPSGQQLLVDWVWNYFSDNNMIKMCNQRVIVTEKAPLYFQHMGHSRTIVGIQITKQRNGMQQRNLLIFDPAHKTEELERSLKSNSGWWKLIKRGVHTLNKSQYQLCFVDPGIACGDEMNKLKTLDSIHIEF